MTLSRWQETVLNLFTEIGKIEPLIQRRVNSTRPAGLDENQFVILNHMIGVGPAGDTRAGVNWTLESLGHDIDGEVDQSIERGLIEVVSDDRLMATDLGRKTHESAVVALSPGFQQLLGGMEIEQLESARNTLREIRRTLDNLPDR
jgi:ribose 1,5-bisphosphokinase PhnN